MQMRTDNAETLRKTFWGGGTVELATSAEPFHVLKCRPSDKFEDGTVAFLDIIALRHGFDFLEHTLGGVAEVQKHVHALTRYSYARLSSLRHANGAPMVLLFGNHAYPAADHMQGGILNFEVLDETGAEVSYKLVEKRAAAAGLHIRAGALLLSCNSGLRSGRRALREFAALHTGGTVDGILVLALSSVLASVPPWCCLVILRHALLSKANGQLIAAISALAQRFSEPGSKFEAARLHHAL